MKDHLKVSIVMFASAMLVLVAFWGIYSTYWAIQTLKNNQIQEAQAISQIVSFLKQSPQK